MVLTRDPRSACNDRRSRVNSVEDRDESNY
jgi:hypothetical protein